MSLVRLPLLLVPIEGKHLFKLQSAFYREIGSKFQFGIFRGIFLI